jgi:hypothetical protein
MAGRVQLFQPAAPTALGRPAFFRRPLIRPLKRHLQLVQMGERNNTGVLEHSDDNARM